MKTSNCLTATLAAALFAGAVITFTSHAAKPPAGHRAFHGHLLERAKEKLGLSDEQLAKIKAELGSEKDTLHALISALHTARVGLREAIQAPDANETSVRAASAKVSVAEADLAVERLKLYGKISPILTEEQREEVKVFQGKIDDFFDTAINRIGEHLAQ